MKNTWSGRRARVVAACLGVLLPLMASAQLTFNNLVVFGTSLSDPGNAFTLLTRPVVGLNLDASVRQNRPPYDTLDESLVPSAPYAVGGHHFSNGATWIEQFAQGRGLASDAGAAFQGKSQKAHNYAVGGARATHYPGRVNLPQQVQAFLGDVGQLPPAEALYVFEIGSNDIRDAVVEFFTVFLATQNQTQASAAASAIIGNALSGIGGTAQTLYARGARKFLFLNAPRIDLTPAVTVLGPDVTAVAANLTNGFNLGLAQGVLAALAGLPGVQVASLDLAGNMGTIVQSPGDFGLQNVTAPCITPNTPPFTCKQPDAFFFWDGIHATKAVHAIISQLAAGVLSRYPNP